MRAGKVGTNSIYPLGTVHAERWRTPIRSSDKGLSPCTAPHTAPKNAVDRELFDHPMAYRGGHGDRSRLSLVKLALSPPTGLAPWNRPTPAGILMSWDLTNRETPQKGRVGIGPTRVWENQLVRGQAR